MAPGVATKKMDHEEEPLDHINNQQPSVKFIMERISEEKHLPAHPQGYIYCGNGIKKTPKTDTLQNYQPMWGIISMGSSRTAETRESGSFGV